MPFRITRSSACQPECLPLNASFNPSCSMLSMSETSPMRAPQRPCGSRYGARSMFSMPPASAQPIWPAQISSAALAIACAPEPHTRLTVIAGTLTGKPPPMAAWRDGFIRTPAWMTLPITTDCTRSPPRPERLRHSRMAAAPSAGALRSFSVPAYVPMAVRTG